MIAIASADRNWGIGRNGDLLCHIPGDLKYFREKTMGAAVVMGRKTLESLPRRRGLPKRVNIVLTSNPAFEAERCTVVHSEEELAEELRKYPEDDVFIIGGESIYRRFCPQCGKCYVTKLEADLGADRFMVNLDEDPAFRMTWESEPREENGIRYRFCLYERTE